MLLLLVSGGCILDSPTSSSDSNDSGDSLQTTSNAPSEELTIVARFTSDCDGLSCRFDAGVSQRPIDGETFYSWSFGDGQSGSGKEVSHTFPQEGEYPVQLEITATEGGSDTQTNIVSVEPSIEARFTSECEGLSCRFDASASQRPSEGETSYSWSFGDGETGSGIQVSHAFHRGGEYTVQLRIVATEGGSDTRTEMISVEPIFQFYIEEPERGAAGADKAGAISEALDVWRQRGYHIQTTSNERQADRHVQFIKDWGGYKLGQSCLSASTQESCLVQVGAGNSDCNNQWTPFDYDTVKAIAIHEVGHAVGRPHSNDSDSVMYHSQSEISYERPCELADDTTELDAGGWYGYTFRFPRTLRAHYEVDAGDSGTFTSGIIEAEDWDRLRSGESVEGWGWRSETSHAEWSGALVEGNYTLAFRCDNSLYDCTIDYWLAWSTGSQ